MLAMANTSTFYWMLILAFMYNCVAVNSQDTQCTYKGLFTKREDIGKFQTVMYQKY